MSLKDRLNTQNKQIEAKNNDFSEPEYYESSEISKQIDTLGVLDSFLADNELNYIYVNGSKNIFLEKKGKVTKSTKTFRDSVQLENLIRKLSKNLPENLNEYTPYFKYNHKEGINLFATLPPLTTNATIFVKCYKDIFANMQKLQEEQFVSKEITLILEALIAISNNIILAGEKNTFKTTLLSSLAKKTPLNTRCVVVDYLNEFSIDLPNFSNYNFLNITNRTDEINILDSIFNFAPDRIFVNSPNDEILDYFVQKIINGYKGITLTIQAKTKEEVVAKFMNAVYKVYSNINSDVAKKLLYNAFDFLVFSKADIDEKRKLSSLSEFSEVGDICELKDIFYINSTFEHQSNGIIPACLKDIQSNLLSFNFNIFEDSYKHTYQKNPKEEAMEKFAKKTANVDILKKFKKELPTEEDVENSKEENKEQDFKQCQETNLSSEQNLDEILNVDYQLNSENNEQNL